MGHLGEIFIVQKQEFTILHLHLNRLHITQMITKGASTWALKNSGIASLNTVKEILTST